MTVTGRVTNGRLVVDEPTELPEGAVVELCLAPAITGDQAAVAARHAEVAGFLEAMTDGYAVLTADQWAEENAERAVWETTSADGLPHE